MITREEWLRHAVEELNTRVFNGDLDLLNHQYRITWGKCPGRRKTECVQPHQGEDIRLEDFFPTTISVSYTLGDPIEMLGALAYECIHAFFNVEKVNKHFKSLANKYYFVEPYTSAHPSVMLNDILKEVYKSLSNNYGKWEDIAKPVIFHKEEKEGVGKNTCVVFCPDCNLEFRVNRKKFEKAGSKAPICGCGRQMGIDYGDEETSSNE